MQRKQSDMLKESNKDIVMQIATYLIDTASRLDDMSMFSLAVTLQPYMKGVLELLHTIYVICTKIVQQTGQGTCEDIMVSKCEQHGENELWFVVKYQHKYTFAQCRYFKANNRLEIHIGY